MGKKTAKSIYKNIHTRDLINIIQKFKVMEEIRKGDIKLKSPEEKGWVWALW